MNSTNKVILTIVIVAGYLFLLATSVTYKLKSGNAQYIGIAAFLFLFVLYILKQVWNKNESSNSTITKNNQINEVNVPNTETNIHPSIVKMKNKIQLLEVGRETNLISDEEYDKKLKEYNSEIKCLEEQILKKRKLEEEALNFDEKKAKLLKLHEVGVIDFNEYSSKLAKLKNGLKIPNYNSINFFPVSIHETNPDSNLKSALGIDTHTLKYTLDKIEYYIKYYKSNEYPFYAALELDRRGEKISHKQMANLIMVAQSIFNESEVNNVFYKLRSASNNVSYEKH